MSPGLIWFCIGVSVGLSHIDKFPTRFMALLPCECGLVVPENGEIKPDMFASL